MNNCTCCLRAVVYARNNYHNSKSYFQLYVFWMIVGVVLVTHHTYCHVLLLDVQLPPNSYRIIKRITIIARISNVIIVLDFSMASDLAEHHSRYKCIAVNSVYMPLLRLSFFWCIFRLQCVSICEHVLRINTLLGRKPYVHNAYTFILCPYIFLYTL